jgi:hypothetical protein
MIDRNTRGLVIDMGMCLRVPFQEIQIEGTNGSNTSRVLRVADLQTTRKHNAIPIEDMRRMDQPQLVRRRCVFKPQGTCGKMPYMSPEIYRNREPFDGQVSRIDQKYHSPKTYTIPHSLFAFICSLCFKKLPRLLIFGQGKNPIGQSTSGDCKFNWL